jgi:uncharacterized membrane protein YbhN (UPF0104 family)
MPVPIPAPIKVAAKTGITCIALAWLVSVVPVRAVGQALASADPWPFGAALILMLAMRVAATARMRVVADAQGLGVSAAALLRLLFAANFHALLHPGTLAGGAATWARYVQQGASRSGALILGVTGADSPAGRENRQ